MRFLHRLRTPARLIPLAAAGALVAVVVWLGYGALQVSTAVTAVSSDPLRDLPLPFAAPPDAGTRQPGLAGAFARGDRVNLLLLGYGGAGHEGAFLTDTVMFASIDARAGVATLVSIPRDLWVTIPKGKYNNAFAAKINEAFAIGAGHNDRDEGIRQASAVVGDVLGVPIDRTIAVDFRAFRTVVDRLAGIDVAVDRAFSSIYPASDTDESWIIVSFKAGLQHMDGETALRYSRARYAEGPEGSDFARSARQMKVILAVKDKVNQTGAAQQLLGLLDALKDNVRTDLSLADLRALGEFAKTYDDGSTVRAGITNQNVLQNYTIQFADGPGYTLQPRADGWGEVHAFVRRLLDHPASVAEDPLVTVRVSRRRADVGAEAVSALDDLDIRARLEMVDGDDPPTTAVSGAAVDSVAALAQYFRGTVEAAGDVPAGPTGATGSTGGTGAAAGPRVLVRLGRDWIPPKPFVLRIQGIPVPSATPAPSPSPSPSPSASARPSSSPSGSPRPSGSTVPGPSPSAGPRPSPVPGPVDR